MTIPYGDLVETITTARFTPVRLREGYDMGEVDELLALVRRSAGSSPVAAPRHLDAPQPSVIQEQRGLLRRLLGDR